MNIFTVAYYILFPSIRLFIKLAAIGHPQKNWITYIKSVIYAYIHLKFDNILRNGKSQGDAILNAIADPWYNGPPLPLLPQ